MIQRKIVLTAVVVAGMLLPACGERKPFVEHKLDITSKGEDCSQVTEAFRMISNFGGERFEFEKCLPVSYKEDQLTSERRGDTVVVKFNAAGSEAGQRSAVTLDIDSYPKYHFITIDDDTYTVISSSN